MPNHRRFESLRIPLAGAAIAAVLASSSAFGAAVEVGAKAPEFSFLGSDGKTHTLAQHLGKRGVVLAWFPKAFTPG